MITPSVNAGVKQGKDIGTQYRSVIFTYGDQQKEAALQSEDSYQKVNILHT